MGVSIYPLRVNISLTPTRFAALVSPNLTQLVLDPIRTFSTFTVLPFLAAAIATYLTYLIMFHGRGHIPGSIEVQGEESAVEPSGFSLILLTTTLGMLVGTSVPGAPVWQITVLTVVSANHCHHAYPIRDAIYDWYRSRPASV